MSKQQPFVEPCYYCGRPADTVDHVIPQVLLKQLEAMGDTEAWSVLYKRHKVKIVPACRDCNSVIGSKYFPTLAERKAFVKQRLRQRKRNVLETPNWSEGELNQLGPDLRGYVEHSIALREETKLRLRW